MYAQKVIMLKYLFAGYDKLYNSNTYNEKREPVKDLQRNFKIVGQSYTMQQPFAEQVHFHKFSLYQGTISYNKREYQVKQSNNAMKSHKQKNKYYNPYRKKGVYHTNIAEKNSFICEQPILKTYDISCQINFNDVMLHLQQKH